VHLPATKDDPAKRKPDITIAKKELGWEPTVSVRDGLAKTIEYFRKELEETVRRPPCLLARITLCPGSVF